MSVCIWTLSLKQLTNSSSMQVYSALKVRFTTFQSVYIKVHRYANVVWSTNRSLHMYSTNCTHSNSTKEEEKNSESVAQPNMLRCRRNLCLLLWIEWRQWIFLTLQCKHKTWFWLFSFMPLFCIVSIFIFRLIANSWVKESNEFQSVFV